jgi:hypothetical protein
MSNITKPKIRVVTSTYNDEKKMEWITELVKRGVPYIIYKKNNTLNETIIRDQYNPTLGYQCLEIPNYGRCEYAFFHHIVTNYDNLDDVTIFTKCNWQEYRISFWELLRNCKNYDYMTVGTHSEIVDYTMNQGTEQYNHIERQYHGNLMLRDILYDDIFSEDVAKPRAVRVWGHGPCFSVSRSLIHRHPKSVYEYLLHMMEFTGNNKNMVNEIGVINHNEIQRFYTVLFTHNVSDSEYTIYPNDMIPLPKELEELEETEEVKGTTNPYVSRKSSNRFKNMLFA